MAKEKVQKQENVSISSQKGSEDKNSSSSKKPTKDTNKKSNQIAIIRISGMVKVPKDIENALYRLRLRRKYVCVIVDTSNPAIKGLLEKVKYYVAFGPINKETYDKLVKERGKKDTEGKMKPFFRLHPPRKGIKSKLQYPKGVLGNNKIDINKLIERML